MSALQTALPVLPLPVPAAAKSVPHRAALSLCCALSPRIFPRILPDKTLPPSARTAFSPQDPTIPEVRCRDPPGIPPRPPPYPAVFRRHRHSCDSWTPGRHFSPKAPDNRHTPRRPSQNPACKYRPPRTICRDAACKTACRHCRSRLSPAARRPPPSRS